MVSRDDHAVAHGHVYEVREDEHMTTGSYLRIAGYTSLWGLLLFLVPMHPMAELQLIFRVPQDYSTIQAAVDAAPEGATILIGPGTYVENITVTKSLTLEGSGMDATILRPPVPTSVPGRLPSENPVLTVQAPQREITLRVRRLTVRSHQRVPEQEVTADIGIKVLTSASLVLEQSAWVDLLVVVSASTLQRLEARDSLFEQDYIVFGGEKFVVQEAVLERNRFIKGANIALHGQHLVAYDNTIICAPELSWFYQVGILFSLREGSQAEIARNSVALCQNGIVVAQNVTEASAVIQDNQLLANNRNIYLIGGARFSEKVYPQIDWSVEGNVIVSGGIGIHADISGGIEGGQVQLKNNRIAWQRKQYVELTPPAAIWYFGNGILLSTSLRRKELKEPLKIEISENRIEHNEAWGLALNLLPGWDGRPDECNVYAPGEEQVFADPEITGSGNEFRNNLKGDLCPADYPWPPGFRKP